MIYCFIYLLFIASVIIHNQLDLTRCATFSPTKSCTAVFNSRNQELETLGWRPCDYKSIDFSCFSLLLGPSRSQRDYHGKLPRKGSSKLGGITCIDEREESWLSMAHDPVVHLVYHRKAFKLLLASKMRRPLWADQFAAEARRR